MITTICKLSYSSRTVPPIVQAVQGDTGRTVRFDVTDFTIPAGAEATYFIEKPSGEAVYNAATISGNSILCELTAQSLAEPGENKMQVRVILDDEIVTSFKVCLLVSTFWGIDAIESSTEMNIFDKAVEQATEDFQEQAEQIVEEVIESIPADYTALTEEVDELNERLDDVKEEIDNVETALPKNYITISLYDSLTFIDGHYVDLSGNIYEHNDMKYAVATSVSVGDVIRFKGRKLGSAYCILLVTSDTSISDKFTVLDAVTDGYSGTDYIESEYTVSQNGYIIYQTRMSSANNYLIKNSVNYYVADSRLLNETTDTLNYVKEQIPSKRIFTDITDDLSFTEHHYVDQNGNIYEYTDVQYAVAGAVSKDDVFEYDGRKVGSAYCILLVTSEDPVNNKYTVLDAVNSGYSETDYIKGTYIVPQNGYLIFQTRITYTKCYLRSSQLYYMFGSSPLNGVKWVTIGDSLNAFDSLITNNWIKLMITETNANNTNLAISGTGFYRGLNTNTNYINRISAIPADTQLITIAGSFNDLSSSPLPEIEVGTATDTGTTTLAGYMNAFFDELLSNFPNASIGVYMTAPWQNYHYGVTRSDDYVNVLKEICLRRCIPFFDNAYYGNALKPWNTANRTEYYTKTDGTVDGVHPNDKGHVFIYQMLKPFIETLSPKSPFDV